MAEGIMGIYRDSSGHGLIPLMARNQWGQDCGRGRGRERFEEEDGVTSAMTSSFPFYYFLFFFSRF